MNKNTTKTAVMTALTFAMVAGTAQAGGLERGGYNIDLLFDPSTYAAEATATYVNPQRELNNVEDINAGNGNLNPGNPLGRPNNGIGDTEGYWVPRVGVKAAFGDSIDCMADYSQPWGAHTNPGANWAGANDNIETKIESDNYAATCSYKWDVGQGQFRIIAGGFYQEVGGFKERLVSPPVPALGLSGVGRLDLEGSGWGWRAGVAYEIPEYALRASLVYNSAVDLDNLDGSVDLSKVILGFVGSDPIIGSRYDVSSFASMPDSLELKVQSGIAPGWLAFGSVKWTDWSQLQIVEVNPVSPSPTHPATSLDLLYRDGWTVTGGVGHKFNDQWSGAVSLTWDRGTSHGYGNQSDTWTVGTGVSYAPTENVELRLAGVVGIMTSGSSAPMDGSSSEITYDFGTDIVSAVSTSLKVKF
ncbi:MULTISPECIES: OmpP1/FadL family transporter [unclassified Rhizobium]|uniref:OmpP1/FadL family transporter n=1 Tax=unclassified Rhizobium TaxID=2613769 RepID=UPI000701975D|nr:MULTISPECIES: OmpP1/FadL family transporter [unclassified Rhizobium]KQV33076.1 long-chain fatty acid transporter [Rhizobium sp. Root1212]KRD21536.1 long-chain fatty acid transporter [Rhizobium sp. Root268]